MQNKSGLKPEIKARSGIGTRILWYSMAGLLVIVLIIAFKKRSVSPLVDHISVMAKREKVTDTFRDPHVPGRYTYYKKGPKTANGLKLEATFLEGIAYLQWKISPDSPHRQLLIERSVDRQTFDLIAHITLSRYKNSRGTFKDRYLSVLKVPHIYYRIRCACHPDNVQFSQVTDLTINELDKLAIYAFPNPASGRVNLQYFSASTSPLQFQVFDSTGQVVMQQPLEPLYGERQTSIPLEAWSEGTYYLQLSDGNQVVKEKLILN